jgi:hypothetical protein
VTRGNADYSGTDQILGALSMVTTHAVQQTEPVIRTSRRIDEIAVSDLRSFGSAFPMFIA